MKNIKELGLELIELEDQVLLVEKSGISVGDYITDSLRVWRWNDDCSLLGRKKVISSTKPLEGLPLLVIEDEAGKKFLEQIAKETPQSFDSSLLMATRHGFVHGYKKAKEKFKFTEDDLRKAIEYGLNYADPFKVGVERLETDNSKFIQSLTKKELHVDIEDYCGSPYTTERCPKCIDCCDRAYQRPKITEGKIKAVWK